MVLGRLFVWSAAIAGGLLVLAIGFLIGENMSKPANTKVTTQSENSSSLLEPDNTYHPTEALVTKLRPEKGYLRRTTFTGELVSIHRSSLAFEVGGLVSEVLVDKGFRVEKDAIIARIDPANIRLQLKQAQAEMQRAVAMLLEMKAGARKTTLQAAEAEVEAIDAELLNLTKQLGRQKQLAIDGVISISELDSIQSLTTATAKRKQAAQRRLDELISGTRPEQIEAQSALTEGLQAKIDLLTLQLQKTQLKAPFAGVILDTFVDQGAVIASGQQVAQLVDVQHLEAHIGVPVATATQLIESSATTNPTFQLRSGNRAWLGVLDRTLPIVDSMTQSVLLVFQIESNQQNLDSRSQDQSKLQSTLFSGAAVELEWEQQVESDGYWVPNQALTQARRGLWSLFACELDTSEGEEQQAVPQADSESMPVVGRVSKLQVEVLYAQNSRSFVRGTFSDQTWIVVDGAHRLLDGQKVQVKQTSRPDYSSAAEADDQVTQ